MIAWTNRDWMTSPRPQPGTVAATGRPGKPNLLRDKLSRALLTELAGEAPNVRSRHGTLLDVRAGREEDDLVHEIVVKLSALDPDAGAAVQVIGRFDALIEGRAGLEPILGAVGVLCHSPARLVIGRHGVDLRVDADGRAERSATQIDPQWLCSPLEPGEPPAFWLERGGDYSLVDAMVLDRAAFAAREVLHRTRGRFPSAGAVDDPAAIEVAVDAGASEEERRRAAALLQLPPQGLVRAIARAGSPARIESVTTAHGSGPRHGRTGIGPAVTPPGLPVSWAQAKIALAFAAEGTDRDPGPPVVQAEELGVLCQLAAGIDRTAPPAPDVQALDNAATAAPWVLGTLDAFTSHASLRLAAAALHLHHSTLQTRIIAIEHDLGWSVREPQGRLRVQLALAVRRFLLHRPD